MSTIPAPIWVRGERTQSESKWTDWAVNADCVGGKNDSSFLPIFPTRRRGLRTIFWLPRKASEMTRLTLVRRNGQTKADLEGSKTAHLKRGFRLQALPSGKARLKLTWHAKTQ